jgi:hypothetical protein
VEILECYRSRSIVNIVKLTEQDGEIRNACRISVGKPVGETPSGAPRRRWEENLPMGLRQVGREAGLAVQRYERVLNLI